ncbi:MAG: phosphoribosylaminoimidazolesuccinocarboxamide synthase [Gloeocapsa sp. DLM2.Bin57]|nr:MAG: phosphoribosylaminoimidazolesuccinocarboxamide synthase [Gloeocapsa sp. DLM2.Bin57]
MSQLEKLYEGKAKIIYRTTEPEVLLTYFKDDATAFNAQKRGTIKGKGEVNCTVSATIFKWLESQGIPTHYLEQTKPNEMRVKGVKIIPLEVVVRNIAAGSLCRETGLALGRILPQPLVEFYLKNDELGDPLLTSDRLALLEMVTSEELETIKQMALKINLALQEFFDSCEITLVDFKLEFGFDGNKQIILADEISPDTCRLWDQNESDPQARVLDKDRFRQDLGAIEAAYQKVKTRVINH